MESPIYYNNKKETLKQFHSRVSAQKIIDTYKEQLEELFLIRNPTYRFQTNYERALQHFLKKHTRGKSLEECGVWVYFPWSELTIHYLPDKLHQELRTARNKNLITKEEQEKFYNCNIGVAGLSVGGHGACTIALMGGAKNFRLADPDTISGSNLNRIRFDYSYIGKNKAEVAAQYAYQLNPYANIEVFSEGITQENISDFFLAKPKLNLLVEELDNLEMKIRLRLEAKKHHIPVIMATDNGDNVIVDIERYDMNPKLPIFNGLIGNFGIEDLQHITPQDVPKLATKIAGADLIVPRMQESLLQVGKTLYSWPQLGDAATLSGVAVAYLARKIALGEPIKSGKFEINLDSIFDANYTKSDNREERKKASSHFLKQIGL